MKQEQLKIEVFNFIKGLKRFVVRHPDGKLVTEENLDYSGLWMVEKNDDVENINVIDVGFYPLDGEDTRVKFFSRYSSFDVFFEEVLVKPLKEKLGRESISF